jgi:hypothetical protein
MMRYSLSVITVLVLMIWPHQARAELVCVHPVPLTLKEMTDRQELGLVSDDVVQANTKTLIEKYCVEVKEPPKAIASIRLNQSCEMRLGYQGKEIVYWSICAAVEAKADQAPIRYPNEAIPADTPISLEILRLVETHPFFANAPRVNLKSYRIKSDSETTSSTSKKISTTSEKIGEIRWLRRGLVRETQLDKGSGVTSHWVYISAANGLVSLDEVTRTTSGGTTTTCRSKLRSLDNIKGQIFPLVSGKRFSFDAKYESSCGTEPPHDFLRKEQCGVVKTYDASLFNSKLTGDAHLVVCRYENFSKDIAGEASMQYVTTFIDALGVWIAADPISSKERIVRGQRYLAGSSNDFSDSWDVNELISFELFQPE